MSARRRPPPPRPLGAVVGPPRSRRRRGGAAARVCALLPLGLALVGALLVARGPGAAAAPGRPAPSGLRGWLTTPDGTHVAAPLGPAAFATAAPGDVRLRVDPRRRYQRVVGFGAALTDSAARVLMRLPPARRTATLRRLFGPGAQARIRVLRVVVGASDFSARASTYDDLPPGRSDPRLRHFSIAHDRAAILPVLRAARAIDPHLLVLATPWSAPAWMKTSGSLYGGSLAPRAAAAYARYLVRFVRAYAAAGVRVAALSTQNEPGHAASDSPSMTFTAAQEARFVSRHLAPALTRAGLSRIAILGHDHNWSDPGRAVALLRSSAARDLAGTAFHCYAGDPSAQSEVHAAAPAKAVWVTECSGGGWSPAFAEDLAWNSTRLLLGSLRNWAQAVLYWNLALDPDGGPHRGGCSSCRGVLTVGPGGEVTTGVEYAVLAQASAAVDPGGVRIGSPASVAGVGTVAFLNPDGSRSLIAVNQAGAERTIAVADPAGAVTSTSLPAGSTLTLRWGGRPSS